jgi:hypothetical protein
MKLEVLSADHQNAADMAAARAREWIDTQGVDALIDMSNASIQLAISPAGQGQEPRGDLRRRPPRLPSR